jgi:leader peptidase (prepilin peptidase)/N-methyltransferase
VWYTEGVEVFFLFFIFIFGLSIGSFLNVLIYRLPRSLKLTGRSFCPTCKKKISWYDNIPVISYLFLRGKCRKCHSPISWQYPAVELVTGILFILVAYLISFDNHYWIIELLSYWVIVSALIVIFFIDLKHQIIPDQVIYPAIVITFLFQTYSLQLAIYSYFLAALGASLFFLILYLVTRGKGMGFGDVKLAVLMGLILGPQRLILALYLAFLTGALIGVILILAKKKRFGEQIPFGPFLSGATIIALFWGETMVKWLTARLF